MKVMSKVSLVLGIVALLIAVGIQVWGVMDVWGNMQPKNSINPINPYPNLWIGFSLGILGGFLTGLGIAAPHRRAAPIPVPTDPTA